MKRKYDGTTITSLGDVRFADGATEVVYFNQLDQRYANQPYGTDNIGGYGCGPTSMAIVVSSLTDDFVDPIEMAEWAYQNGGWCTGQGSRSTGAYRSGRSLSDRMLLQMRFT